ncbi:MAG: hypothetical protein HY210_06940 [Candidatus Omnitrophica bacterium]|nr:hypothetical protein [Candidatus Omnitrophota bacterium]
MKGATMIQRNSMLLKFLQFFAAILIIPGLTSCASIVKGGGQNISINSKPSDANVEVFDMNGATVGTGATPYKIYLKTGRGYFSSQDYKVVINKSGYSSKTIYLSSRVSGWYAFGNLLFGGLIGYLIVDPLTGSMWTLEPMNIDASLGEQVSQIEEGAKVLYIVLRDQLSPELQAQMKPVN